jgi:uncharacterized protein (DUF2461 family)
MPGATKPALPAALPYFRPQALTFLRNLAKHNDRDWFTPRKAEFEAELKEPMLAVVRKITDAMLDFAPSHVRPAEKSLFRIYRDTRFSNDKRPYKTHVAAWWSHQGLQKTSGAGYYFHVSAKEVIIAAGAYMPEKEQLAQIRHWLLDNHVAFRKLLQKPAVRSASCARSDPVPPVGTFSHATRKGRARSQTGLGDRSSLQARRAHHRRAQHTYCGGARAQEEGTLRAPLTHHGARLFSAIGAPLEGLKGQKPAILA